MGAHCYATVAELDDYLTDNGATKLAQQAGRMVARKLKALEGASRRVDGYAERSYSNAEGAFGPRIATLFFDPPGCNVLELDEDLLAITSVTTYDTPGGSSSTLIDETDFYKRRGATYGQPPYRQLEIHEGSGAAWGYATRGNAIAGKWGERDERVTLTAVTAEAIDASEIVIDVTDADAELSPGMTFLLGAEQMYIRAVTRGTPDRITVDRGANGTTPETHLTGLAIARYIYHPEVHSTTLQVATRRLRGRAAGLTPGFAPEGGGATMNQDSEHAILRAGLELLVYRSAG